jgi:DNA mismatch endonuclease (patch repair protein)
MTDVFEPSKRSEIMSRVKGTANRNTEERLIEIFKKHSIVGWRRRAKLFGKPDFIFPRQHIAIFVDGCFWHRCPKHASQPVSNAEFWNAKLARNSARDKLVNRKLKKQGWHILRIWQHELSRRNEYRLLRRIERAGISR